MKKRVLLAVTQEEEAKLRAALQPDYELVTARVVSEVLDLLQQEQFDAIIAGVDFDESRMFDLLRTIKADASLKSVPFVCFRGREPPLTVELEASVITLAQALGACGYLSSTDFAYTQKAGEELRLAIERCITRSGEAPGE
ncbi:MAG TPA: hypothetical protein V6D08_07160 [Candidatus Obscuribacterales bacterium]